MNLTNGIIKARQALSSNSPELLTAIGISGVITTAYLTGKASVLAHEDLSEQYELSIKEKAKLVWKLYIPAGISGFLTVGCIVNASRVTGRRTAAAVAAYSITERAFSEYKEKVVEELGKGKEQKIRDHIAQDRVNATPPGSKEVIIAGTGHVMCCELYTHRYFRSDMETLRKAQNDINLMIINQYYVTLDDFYDTIGIGNTSESDKLGWDSNKLLDLEFSTILSDSGEPCLAFSYNYVKPLR